MTAIKAGTRLDSVQFPITQKILKISKKLLKNLKKIYILLKILNPENSLNLYYLFKILENPKIS
jgi:hypothetical protein